MPKKMHQKELDYIRDIKAGALTGTETDASSSRFLIIVLVLVSILIIWAFFFKIDEVTVGQGKVIPSSKVKNIQSLEGGIVDHLSVSEGEMVKKGQLLITLADTQYKADLGEKLARLHALQAKAARLKAEVHNEDTIKWPREIKNLKVLQLRETRIMRSRQESLDSKLRFLSERIDLHEKEITMLEPLVEKGLMAKVDMYRLQQKLLELKGKKKETQDRYVEVSDQELNDTLNEINAIKELMVAIQDKIRRSKIKSPVNGTIKVIEVSTKGEVLHPGQTIMEIVPQEESLLIEAQINPKDIGFISPEQDVIVKVSAYDFAVYGGLDGKLKNISADTVKDPQDNYYYVIQVKTDDNHLEKDGKRFDIIPGMTVEVNILTGKRSILAYVFKPILRGVSRSMGER